MSEPAERLTTLLTGSPRHLDRLMAVVASAAPDPPAEDAVVDAFDRLADGATDGATADDVLSYLHGELGFVGNGADYYNPANSYVHRVLGDRRGIPLTLAAVAVEVGRRRGVHLTIVGLPGHVIVGDGHQPTRWFDPFAGGAELGVDGCRRLFARFHPIESFEERMLEPIGPTATTMRMLANLKVAYRRLGDLSQMVKILELSVAVPGAPVSERHEYATMLAAVGREDLAARQRDLLAKLDKPRADAHQAAARRHRARRN